MQNNNKKLITAPDAVRFFDGISPRMDVGVIALKFMVIQEIDKPIQFLVHSNSVVDKTLNNAFVLLNYMIENNIKVIRVNGGAHLNIDTGLSKAKVSKSSLAFGGVCKPEATMLLLDILHTDHLAHAYVVDFDPKWENLYKSEEKDMENDGKTYTIEEVRKEVSNS